MHEQALARPRAHLRPLRGGHRPDPRARHPVGRGRLRRGPGILGGKRNPSSDATKAFSSETEIIASNSTYGTRQSNKRDGDGGGAIYGCRSNPGNEPCLRGQQPQGRPRVRVRDGRQGGGAHRDRRHHRRAVHHQRDRRGDRPERRQASTARTRRTSPGAATCWFADGGRLTARWGRIKRGAVPPRRSRHGTPTRSRSTAT